MGKWYNSIAGLRLGLGVKAQSSTSHSVAMTSHSPPVSTQSMCPPNPKAHPVLPLVSCCSPVAHADSKSMAQGATRLAVVGLPHTDSPGAAPSGLTWPTSSCRRMFHGRGG